MDNTINRPARIQLELLRNILATGVPGAISNPWTRRSLVRSGYAVEYMGAWELTSAGAQALAEAGLL